MPANWEEGNAARQPMPEPSANPFVPVDYTSRLQEMPRRAAHGGQVSYQPGQRYGHVPGGYGAAAPMNAHAAPWNGGASNGMPGVGAGMYAQMPQAMQPQGMPYMQPPQSIQLPMNPPDAWGDPAAGMTQGRAMQFHPPQGMPYAQAAQTAQWNGSAPGGMPGASPVPYEAYLSGTPQPAAWSSPAGAAPQTMPYAPMLHPMQGFPQYGGMQNGMPGASPMPPAPFAQPMQGRQGNTQTANPWNAATDGASLSKGMGEWQRAQPAQDSQPAWEAQAAPEADAARSNANSAGDAPAAASTSQVASAEAPAYLKRRSARLAAGAQGARHARDAQAVSAPDAPRSNADLMDAVPAAASAPRTDSASPEIPAYLKRRSARLAAAAQEARPARDAQAVSASDAPRSSADPTDAVPAAASAPRTDSASPEIPARLRRRSARQATGAQEVQDARTAQNAQSVSANAEPAAAPRRRRHAVAEKAPAQPSEPSATPSRRAQRRAESPSSSSAPPMAASSPAEMRDAYSPRASHASSFPEMEQGMAAAFPEGAMPVWNAASAPEYDGAPSPEAFFAEEAAPTADPESARDPHALRDPFTPAKSRKGRGAQAASAPSRPPVRPWRVAALLVVIAMLLFCLIAGGSLIARLSQNERRMNQAREDYRHSMGVDLLSDASRVVLLPEGQTYAPTQTIAAQPVQTPVPTPIIPMNEAAIVDMNRRDTSAVQEPEASPAPTSARTRLTAYPKNEMRNLMAALEPLREENSEVVGHLVIDGLIDEVVVQRNNTFYLTHNYRGSSSSAGAVFADESCTFFKPPENLLLRGQSAVENQIFAPLWQYATGGISFAASHTHAQLTTLYEAETYVLLAVIQAASDPSDPNYFNYASHPTFTTDADFLQYVQEAREHSLYPINVDVGAGDRLLTLATVGGESCLVLIFKMIV